MLRVLINDNVEDVDLLVVETWLPGLHDLAMLHSSPFLDGDLMVETIRNHLFDRTLMTISPYTITKALKELLSQMRPTMMNAARYMTDSRIRQSMKDCLSKDTSHSFNQNGLQRSRQRYLIYCVAAKYTQSQMLAKLMARFFEDHADDIAENEREEFLMEWRLAIQDLHGLIHEHKIRELLHMIPPFGNSAYNPWAHAAFNDPRAEAAMRMFMAAQQNPFYGHHRGRSPLMLGGPGGYIRARSLPGRRRRRHDMQLALPRNHNPAWNSPIVSPALIQPNGYFDEVGQLKYQQEEMNMKLDNIDNKLDWLIR